MYESLFAVKNGTNINNVSHIVLLKIMDTLCAVPRSGWQCIFS